MLKSLQTDGYARVQRVLDAARIERLKTVAGQGIALSRGGSTFGGRNLLAVPDVRNLAAERAIRNLIDPIVGSTAIPVRTLFFDKTP